MVTRTHPKNGSNRYGKSIRSHKKDFSRIPSIETPRSTFDRSSGLKTAFDSGQLVPVFVDEVLPGDTFHLTTQCIARMSTPVVPIMDNLQMDVHYFFVPTRLVWDNFQRFMGERKNPGDSVDFTVPQIKFVDPIPSGSLPDYFGIPIGVPNVEVSALPFRAYKLIYNEWFRDQNLMVTVDFPTGDELQVYEKGKMPICALRSKRHDYFTSCLPWPQKGTGVELPLGVPNIEYGRPMFLNGMNNPPADSDVVADASGGLFVNNAVITAGTELAFTDLGIELTSGDALTINTMRQAFQIQRMLERDARGGSRYVEIIRSHFGVISPDARMQRPEYLGMSSFDININPVAQTGSTDETSPQGNLSAYGVAGGSGGGFSQSFTEHGHIIGVASVRADLTYQQGLNRMWSRKTRFDYYWPTLAHLGEQAVLNKEIFLQSNEQDEDVFGYQERHAEYRYKPSMITGKMRSADPQSLDAWHLSQYFVNLPTLNHSFIEEHIPMSRILAVQNEPQFIADFHFKLNCVRAMPTYSVPGLIDHF